MKVREYESEKNFRLTIETFFRIAGIHWQPNTDYLILITEYRILITEYRIPNTDYRILVAGS